jgi:hypothetical protein
MVMWRQFPRAFQGHEERHVSMIRVYYKKIINFVWSGSDATAKVIITLSEESNIVVCFQKKT